MSCREITVLFQPILAARWRDSAVKSKVQKFKRLFTLVRFSQLCYCVSGDPLDYYFYF